MAYNLPILTRALPVLRVRLVTPLTRKQIRERIGDTLIVPEVPPFPLAWNVDGFRGVAGGLNIRGILTDEDAHRALTVWLSPVPPVLFALLAFALAGFVIGSVSETTAQVILVGIALLAYGLGLLAFQSRARAVDAHLRHLLTEQEPP